MILCSLAALGVLSSMGFRRHVPWAGVLFAVAAVCTFLIGGMASAAQTVSMQWVQEGINSSGQIGFALGALLLYRHCQAQGAA